MGGEKRRIHYPDTQHHSQEGISSVISEILSMKLQCSTFGKVHQVELLHITNWSPDGHCSNLSSVTGVMEEMSRIQRRTGTHPIVVHCR